MELRSHSSVSRHLVAIHGTPTQDEGNVIQIYYRYEAGYIRFQILVLLPEDGGRQPKHVGEGTFIYIHTHSRTYL
jgi:hypothetical protein